MKIVKSLQKHPEEWFGCTFLRRNSSATWVGQEPENALPCKFSNTLGSQCSTQKKSPWKPHMRRSLSGRVVGIPAFHQFHLLTEGCQILKNLLQSFGRWEHAKRIKKMFWKTQISCKKWQTVQFLRIMVSMCQMIWLKSGNWKSYQIPNTMPIRKKGDVSFQFLGGHGISNPLTIELPLFGWHNP